MPLRNKKNQAKSEKKIISKNKKEKGVFVDLLGSDDFDEYVNFIRSPKKTFFFNFL